MRKRKMQTRLKPRFRKTYFREWRKHRDLTLEEAADKIGEYLRDHNVAIGYTYATLGRLERGIIGYTQIVLEAMEHVYKTDAASLLMRDPEDDDADGIMRILRRANSGDRQKILEIAKTITGKSD
jgi:transcriptional regulator with XRE-family HTH domain